MDSGLAEDSWQIGWIDVAAGAKWKVLRSLNVGSAAAEKSAAEAEKVSAAAEKRSAVAKSGGCGGGETAVGTPRRRAGKSPAGEMKRLTRRTRSAYPGFLPAHAEIREDGAADRSAGRAEAGEAEVGSRDVRSLL